MSGRFSPLTAPLPFRDLPLRAPLLYSDCSAHLNFWPAPLRFPLRSNALLLRSHDCQYVRSSLPAQVLFYLVLLYWQLQHKICTKSQDLALKISKFFQGYYPWTPRLPHPPPARPKAVRGGLRPQCRNPRFQNRSPKSKIATTPLMLVWGSRGIPYTVTCTKWQKKVAAAPCSETAWAKKLKECTETCFLAHYYACKFGWNRLRIDRDIRQKTL